MWLALRKLYWQRRAVIAQRFKVSLELTIANERKRAINDAKHCEAVLRSIDIEEGFAAAAAMRARNE